MESWRGARVALVHDYWAALRGGERVFLALARMYPEADCYALIRRPEMPFPHPRGEQLRTSALQAIPFGPRHFRMLLPLYPLAARSLDLRGYDLVISSSSGFCHGVRTDGLHLCYCHAPLRYAWNEYDATLAGVRSPLARATLRRTLDYVRREDRASARRVAAYVANSVAVQRRIRAYYGRESAIVHPFVDLDRFRPSPAPPPGSPYLLVVSQLLAYKRVDLAVDACTLLGRSLVVVGDGPERARLERRAGPSVRFLGRVSEEELPLLYADCAGLVQCAEEDFGIAALEAQACGRPVLAYGAAGALETVVDGLTGIHFAEQSTAAVVDALERFDPGDFDPALVRAHAEWFDEARFRSGMHSAIESAAGREEEASAASDGPAGVSSSGAAHPRASRAASVTTRAVATPIARSSGRRDSGSNERR